MITWWISYEFRYITTTKKNTCTSVIRIQKNCNPIFKWNCFIGGYFRFDSMLLLSWRIALSVEKKLMIYHHQHQNRQPFSESAHCSSLLNFPSSKTISEFIFFWKKTIKQNRTEIGLVIILSRVCVFAMRNAIFIFLKIFYLRKFCFFYYRKKQAVIFLKKKKFNDYPMMMVDSIHFIDTYDRCVWPVFFVFKKKDSFQFIQIFFGLFLFSVNEIWNRWILISHCMMISW